MRRGSESAKKLPLLIADIIGAMGKVAVPAPPVVDVAVAVADAALDDERVLALRLGKSVTRCPYPSRLLLLKVFGRVIVANANEVVLLLLLLFLRIDEEGMGMV